MILFMYGYMRQFSPYEYNHLLRHGIKPESIPESETSPVEYLTGYVEFAGREWHINPNALIPRIETEELLHHAVETARALTTTRLEAASNELYWAEIGTGSAALGLSFYLELQKQKIKNNGWLSDISEVALTVAKENAAEVNADIHLLASDLFTQFDPALRFDIILANLPYIPSERIAYLDESVKDHEPEVALDGGPEGLTLIKRLLTELPTRLSPQGSAWLEIDYTHTVDELNEDNSLTETLQKIEIISHFDQFERQRFWEVKLRS